ncbi:hypothetical protein [Sphingomonas jatrophae]|uniref:Uncharacterized protein n=1 Tax=Sphingomonas jatrophae TaxID=1166337 RepID=A0A1I6LLV6_9SPHN|nr:hypothetical protein [Sphingomonas jatrophae]SFS04300.1 hypothetical protein SAMN05192580_2913 [Sphingomonas jatrophae]
MIAAAAPPPAIVFAPPPTPLRYETRLERPGARGPIVLRMTHDVRFTREGAGWRLEAVQTGYGATGSANAAALLDAAMAPMTGVPVTLMLGRGGAAGALIGGEAVWARVLAGQAAARRTIAARPGLPPAVRAAADGVFAQAAAMRPAERQAALAEWPTELVAPAADSLPAAGETVVSAGPLGGHARWLRADAQSVSYAIDLAGDGIERRDELTVERATGLVLRSVSRRTVRLPGAPAQTMVRTLQRLP